MASITTRKNGSRFINFKDGEGKRQTITLGKISKRFAQAFRVKVEDLVSAAISGHAPSDETSLWLRDLSDDWVTKLARVGLASPRASETLGYWLKRYLDDRKEEIKPTSHRKLEQTKKKLLGFFGSRTPLRKITPDQAAAWRVSLRDQKLSEAGIKTHSGNAKTMMQEAVKRKLIGENPFKHLKSGPTPSKYNRYITADEIQRVIDACPDAEWKLLFGLARYAGLRVPSESHGLTWNDVDWEHSRLTVRSPKTEHHAGHEQRVVPITPNLMELLQERFDDCEEGEEHLVAIRGQGCIAKQVRAICARAGVEQWKRLWQTLRGSCEKEWAMTLPQYAVSRWIGHSITVSGRHYANAVPDELFDRAAGRMADSPSGAQRNAQRKASETAGNGQKSQADETDGEVSNAFPFSNLQQFSDHFLPNEDWRRGESNPRPATDPDVPLRA